MAIVLAFCFTARPWQVSIERDFLVLPDNDDSLKAWLSNAGWRHCYVERRGKSVSIDASRTIFETRLLSPPWNELGYQPVGGYVTKVNPSKDAMLTVLAYVLVAWLLLVGMRIITESRDTVPDS